MDKGVIDQRVVISLTPREAYDFLNRLSNDDAFRSRFNAQPRAVLAEHHIQFPTDFEITLPSKEFLQNALHQFSATGKVDARRLSSPEGWPLLLFWWLYMTPAKPRRGGAEG